MTEWKPCGITAPDSNLICGYADGHDGPHSWGERHD